MFGYKMNLFKDFQAILLEQLEIMTAEGQLPGGLDLARVTVEPPRDPAHGDMATNAAMVLAKAAGRKPRELAELLAERLKRAEGVVAVEIAGPGFINLRLNDKVWSEQLRGILAAGERFGESGMGQNQLANVEYVSANPTGPLTVGHARGAVVGDALASLLEKAGYRVLREYYVNDAGGLNVGGRRMKLEHIEYDDRSQSEEAVRAVERLISQDKVDILLPPWGTGQNLAVAPIFARGGYPMLAGSMASDRIAEIVKRWPNIFSTLNTSSVYAESLVATLNELRSTGAIGNRVAVVNAAEQFGIELGNAARRALKAANYELVYDGSYPMSTQDLTPVISEARTRSDHTPAEASHSWHRSQRTGATTWSAMRVRTSRP